MPIRRLVFAVATLTTLAIVLFAAGLLPTIATAQANTAHRRRDIGSETWSRSGQSRLATPAALHAMRPSAPATPQPGLTVTPVAASAAGPGMTMTPMMTGTRGPMTSATPMMGGTPGSMMTMTAMTTGMPDSMMTGTPMMTMTPMMTATLMTGTPGPMMTMTPWLRPTPEGDDRQPPTGGILVNGGAQFTTSPTVTLTLTATDNPGGTGVRWMLIREWGWDNGHGWHDMHQGGPGGGMGSMMSGWQLFAPTVAWPLSPQPGVKYIGIWFADAAWNVSPPATAMISLAADAMSIGHGQVYQYRCFLQAGQPMTVTLHPRAGDPDLYLWMPGHTGVPDLWSNAANGDDQVVFAAPTDGVYLIEVHGYSAAIYDLSTGVRNGPETASVRQDKPLPPAPAVVDTPDTALAPVPGFRVYLPVIARHD